MAAERSKTDCWIDVFELSQFRGRRRRLYGPGQFVSLRSRSADWGASIDSLIVGPKAYVRLFRSSHPHTAVHWLSPRQAVGDVLKLNIHDDVDSVQILDRTPTRTDPGYDAFRAGD
jgi:hypothetical protein